MQNNNAHTAAENYANSAPVPNFGTAYRSISAEQRRKRIMQQAEALCAAEVDCKPWDIRLFADRLVESVMAVRAGAE